MCEIYDVINQFQLFILVHQYFSKIFYFNLQIILLFRLCGSCILHKRYMKE